MEKLSRTAPQGSEAATSAMSEELLTSPGTALGTVAYMSPEQALGEELDARSDLFSFGVVLYEIATGARPFTGATTAALFNAILNKAPVSPAQLNPGTPVELERIINKALEKDREVRYQHASELRADLQHLKDGAVTWSAPRTIPRRRWLALAATGALVVLGIAAGWFWLHRHVPGDHHEIVLAGFDNPTGEPEFDQALSTALAIDLKQSPFLLIASGSKVRDALKLMERSPQEKLTPSLAREVCQRINDQAVLTGKIARFGRQYLITLTATDCVSGEDLVEAKAVAEDRDGMLNAVDSLAAEMRQRLGEPLKSLKQFSKPLPAKRTGSLDALKAYSQAAGMSGRGDYRGAIPFYQRAIELDPKFAVAYADLGTAYRTLQENELATENLKKAYELRDMATEGDRLFIVAQYHGRVTGNLEESIRNYQTWTETYPKDMVPWDNLAARQINIGRPNLAIAPAMQALAMAPKDPHVYITLARAQMQSGQTDKALATCRQAIARGVEYWEIHMLLAQLAFARHDTAAMTNELAWADGKPSKPDMLEWEMVADFAQGKRRVALDATRQLVDGYKKQGMDESANVVQAEALRALAELGWTADARAMISRLPPVNDSDDLLVALAEIGEIAKAEEILKRELAAHPEDTIWQEVTGPLTRGAIALSRHNPEEAIEALRPSLAYDLRSFDPIEMRGRAYLAAKKPDLAAIEFRKIIDHPTIDPMSYCLPLAHLGLARAYAMQGDTASSRAEYQKLLDLWKDADPDVPAKDQAARELTALR